MISTTTLVIAAVTATCCLARYWTKRSREAIESRLRETIHETSEEQTARGRAKDAAIDQAQRLAAAQVVASIGTLSGTAGVLISIGKDVMTIGQ